MSASYSAIAPLPSPFSLAPRHPSPPSTSTPVILMTCSPGSPGSSSLCHPSTATAAFSPLNADEHERMRCIQQLAKRRRSSIVSPEQPSSSAYSIPSPSSSLHSTFAQLSLQSRAEPPRTSTPPTPSTYSPPRQPRVPLSSRRLFTDLDRERVAAAAANGSESSTTLSLSSRRTSLKRTLEEDDDDFTELSHNSNDAHSDEHKAGDASCSSSNDSPDPPLPTPSPPPQPRLRERPRRWTTPAAAPSDTAATPQSRPSTPFTSSFAARPPPRPFVVPAFSHPDDSSSLYLPGSLSSSPSSSPTSASSSPYPGKRVSLTSLMDVHPHHLTIPPSRPPTPLASAASKRLSLPATFKVSTLASLAESVAMREEEEVEEGVGEEGGRGGGGGRGWEIGGGEAVGRRRSGSAFAFWPSAGSVGKEGGVGGLELKAVGGRTDRRRSLASAGARSIWNGQ